MINKHINLKQAIILQAIKTNYKNKNHTSAPSGVYTLELSSWHVMDPIINQRSTDSDQQKNKVMCIKAREKCKKTTSSTQELAAGLGMDLGEIGYKNTTNVVRR